MSDAAAPSPKKSASKAKKAAPKPAEHPKYGEMVAVAIGALKERSGSSRIAILKYLTANYKISDGANTYLKQALKRGVASGEFKQVKGAGASGSFKLADKPKKAAAKKPAAKKPAAKKPSKKDAELLVPTRYTIPPCPMSRTDTLAYVDKLKKEL